MVRLYVQTDGGGLPLDFEVDEADEIAEELRAVGERARDRQPTIEQGCAQHGGENAP